MSRLAGMPRRPGATAILAATILLVVVAAAAAHFTTTGSGTASAGIGALARPTITAATAGAGSAKLSWSSVTPPGSGTVSYYVTRDGGAPGGDCPSSSSASAITSCTDSGLALGSHKYTVTAVWRSWTAISEAKSVEVTKLSQTISFTSTAPSTATVGGATYTVSATGGASGNPVTFTIDAVSSSVCSIAGKTVSFTAVGTCTVDANQAGSSNYEAAPQAQQSFTVGKGSQTISFTSTAPSEAGIGGTYTPTATATPSELPVTLSIDSSSSAVCSIAAGVVSFKAAGTCRVDANQAGNTNWNSATQMQQSFTVTSALTITSVVRDGGKKKVHFTGTGAVASTTITVTICTVNSFPCTGANIAGTSTASGPSAGNWTSAQDSNNLNESATFFAQAVQGSATSAVFTFSTWGL